MNLRTIGYSLAGLSLALGAAELIAGKRIARRLGLPRHDGLVRMFGLREIGTGVALLARPTSSSTAWARIAGDMLDLAALGAALQSRRGNRSALLATMGFVGSALLADASAAYAMRRGGASR